MAAKVRTLDIWIVESNTVYRDVPFTVVSDWIQQGRLLGDDRGRQSAKGEWVPLGEVPDFSPYFPKTAAYRAEDRAEALQPVQMDFGWKQRGGEDDEDFDMIPLIDVSLVLLIFFIMTASGINSQTPIKTPGAKNAFALVKTKYWIGMNKGADGELIYSLGEGERGPTAGEERMSFEEALKALDRRIKENERPVEVRLRADETIQKGKIDRLKIELEKYRSRGGDQGIEKIYDEVSEREPS
jgi:biopolymer transport protein ExbD